MENLERAALLGYGLKPVEFDPFFFRKIEFASNEGVRRRGDVLQCCLVQAAMVCLDHDNSRTGV